MCEQHRAAAWTERTDQARRIKGDLDQMEELGKEVGAVLGDFARQLAALNDELRGYPAQPKLRLIPGGQCP